MNSPLKLQQTNTKEPGATAGVGGRKSSLSGAFNASSTVSGRPSGRRRDTSDSFQANGPLSPTGTKQSFFKDESITSTPPPALLRRRTDFRDENPESQETLKTADSASQRQSEEADTPFASLKRSTTNPLSSAFSASTNSPWSSGPSNSAFGSMGTFGSFTVGPSSTAQDNERRPGFGSGRSASRFKDILNKTGSEEDPAVRQKPSLGHLENLPEDDDEAGPISAPQAFKTRPNRSETNPYEDLTFSRGGDGPLSAQDHGQHGPGIEQLGFSAFGTMSSSTSRDFLQRERADPTYQQTYQQRYHSQEPMSPTGTNPYHSPSGTGNRGDEDEMEPPEPQSSGTSAFASLRRNMMSGSEDRSQTSSASNIRSNTGVATSAGWPSLGLTSGTPARGSAMTAAFGDSIFSPMSDLQSPSLAGFGGTGAFGVGGPRSSRLGGLFPPAMQEQMGGEASRNERDHLPSGLDTKGEAYSSVRDPFDGSARRREGFFDDLSASQDAQASPIPIGQPGLFPSGTYGPGAVPLAAMATGSRLPNSTEPGASSGHGLSQSSDSSSSNQMPSAQQRQMVMPDRMRWIYRDPQGNTQGPWSGLEMHDWFKAGFFTAELQVKKLEDTEFEPLAQLVRRIGNSREPFLVPQIGVPHGPAPAIQGNHWANTPGTTGPPAPGAQPPFASSFPSFGTTLTAEQQNALERRKQEEQFLMARQKEHLAQQQALMKQMQMQNGPHGLHSLQHHSSAHSLHSQPSFGSITSPPATYQPSPMPPPIQPPHHSSGFADGVIRQPPTSNMPAPSRDEDLHKYADRLSFTQRASAAPGGATSAPQPPDQIAAMLQDRARLQAEQQQSDMRGHRETFLGSGGQNERLTEFNMLRSSEYPQSSDTVSQQPIGAPQHNFDDYEPRHTLPSSLGAIGKPEKRETSEQQNEPLSLTQQVQRAAASHEQASVRDSHGVAPPISNSPLPAPAAQRNRQHVADALAAESRSTSQTPIEASGASIAPWAEKSAEIPKGPSLKEIQEAEARKAAEQEDIAAATRKAQTEAERTSQPLPPAPGLPATSTWGSAISPSTQSGAASSVWAKPTTGKPIVTPATSQAKKTLAQIQKEEETRKQRAAAAVAAVQTPGSAASAAGKRYAELASKVAPVTPIASSHASAWTTVGSGGKAKAPATVVATPQTASRTTSTTTIPQKVKPILQTTRSTASVNQSKAADEFSKWAKSALGKGLNNNINGK